MANRIPHLRKKQGRQRFGEIQTARDAKRVRTIQPVQVPVGVTSRKQSDG